MSAKLDPRATLSTLIGASGLSISVWARDVMGRDVRTVRRWLNGEQVIPQSAAQWIARVRTVEPVRGGTRVTVGKPDQ